MRIAVIGAGVSGLVAAHLLADLHDVTVFEAQERPGGHTHTVRVDTEHQTHMVDTGFIVCNDRNYPTLDRVFERLRVATQPSRMSFSVSADGEDFEYAGTPRGLFAQRANLARPKFLRMIADLVRFNRDARSLLAGEERTSLADWLAARDYSKWFVDRLLLPQASAVWSADPNQMWSFPARFLARFFHHHGMLGFRDRPQWRTVAGGSQTYVDAICGPLGDRVRLSSPVRGVTRGEEGVDIDAGGDGPQRFDQVVLACHSDQALAMLCDPSDRERELLSAIPYQPNEAILHTDRSLLPRRRDAWASWNYHLLPQRPEQTKLTYWMNNLQSLEADREFLVTLNRAEAIDPATVIKKISYAHPVFTPQGMDAQQRHGEISGVAQRTHYCGAWWRWGFHEDGAVSGLRVAEALGGGL